MPVSDPTTPASYAFLPWLRRGVIGLADNSNVPNADTRQLTLTLNATGEGEAPVPVKRTVRLYGPEDITGIDPRAIVRTLPGNGVGNFEYNYLCGIEFYDEDFPWRYTPALPADSKLPPWIWLVVLKDDEFVRSGPAETGLATITIETAAMGQVFPDPGTTWAWAHTHLNFSPQGADNAAMAASVQATLDADPNLGCSRLLCPRRLEGDMHYTAFLIPAFEKGRLAGLGKDQATIDAAPGTQASWPGPAGEPMAFPIYFEWQFATAAGGDFESLARKISPLDKKESDLLAGAGKTLDIRNPGWGLTYAGRAAGTTVPASPGSMDFASALIYPGQPPSYLLTETFTPEDLAFTKSLETLLNLGATMATPDAGWRSTANPFFDNSQLQDDPLVLPPVYGSFYRDNPSAVNSANPGLLHSSVLVPDWFDLLNLNPSMRVVAAQGTAVVQKDQDSYINRAWDQLSQDHDTTRVVKRWNYSLEVSQTLFNRRFQPVIQPASLAAGDTTVTAFRAINFTAPMHTSLKLGSNSYLASILKKFMPSAYTRPFAKIVRPGGPVIKRLSRNPGGGGVFFIDMGFIRSFNDTLNETILSNLDYLNKLKLIRIKFPTRGKDNALRAAGLAGYDACVTALTSLGPFVQMYNVVSEHPNITFLFDNLHDQLNPSAAMMARLQGMIPFANLSLANSITVNEPAAPEFPDPMYQPLADRSLDYILPGLEGIPDNRVALLYTNQRFIEAYMVGLNHEMSREYQWREFPAPLNSTSFRQFWDVRDSQAAMADPEAYKDISAIASWPAFSNLGSNKPAARPFETFVILVRSDLLHKYPNAEVFMQKGEWDGATPPVLRPVASPVEGVSLRRPIFSAQLSGGYRFMGFDLPIIEAVGAFGQPGWFFVLKERAGEIHFGLDIDAGTTDPSWAGLDPETPAGACINAAGQVFTKLPRYTAGRADAIAGMLYQQPFMLFTQVSRLLPKN